MNYGELSIGRTDVIDPLLTEKQLCSWFGIGHATASRWRYSGVGPRFLQLGPRRIAYRKSEIEHWLQTQERNRNRVVLTTNDAA